VDSVGTGLILVSSGFVWFIGKVIERSGVSFTVKLPDFGEVVVKDLDTLLAAPPEVRRDIVVGYMNFSGAPRLLIGGFMIVILMTVSWLILARVAIQRRFQLIGVVVLRSLALAVVPWMLPDPVIDVMDLGASELARLLGPWTSVFWSIATDVVRVMRPFLGIVWYHSTRIPQFEFELRPDPPKLSGLFFTSLLSLTRRSTLKVVEALNDIRLPEFISNVYEPPTLDSVGRAYQLLVDVGFPVNQQFLDDLKGAVNDPTASSYLAEHGSWKKWFLGSVSTKLGYNKLKVAKHSWLPDNFFEVFPGYLHVASWNAEEPEVRSTSRYWTGNETSEIPGGAAPLEDDIWEAV
jgi:hypothetical protein